MEINSLNRGSGEVIENISAQKTSDAVEASNTVTKPYRAKLAEILWEIHEYTGTEEQYENLMKSLIELEEWMCSVFGNEKMTRLPTNLEREVGNSLLDRNDRTVDDLLEFIQRRFDRWLDRTENKDYLVVETEGVFLPSGDNSVFGVGEKDFEAPRFHGRLQELLSFLHQNEIFRDDVIIIKGKVKSEMMRKRPYVLIEIPKIECQILVCDQVGEATFVIQNILNRDTFQQLSKEQLRKMYPGTVHKIEYRKQKQWEQKLFEKLFENVDLESVQKVDIHVLEELRREVKKQVPTASEWADMKQKKTKDPKDKRRFKVYGMGLTKLARTFSVEGYPIDKHEVHLLLGQKIYGECEVLKIWTNEEIVNEVKKQVPTASEWADMKYRRRFKVCGMTLYTLSTRFGVEGDPASNPEVHLELGRKLYGVQS